MQIENWKLKNQWRFLLNYSLADQLTFSVWNFAFSVFAARTLSPEAFGHFSIVLVFIFLGTETIHCLLTRPMQTSFGSRSTSRESFFEDHFQLGITLSLPVALIVGIATFFYVDLILNVKQALNLAFAAAALSLVRSIFEIRRKILHLSNRYMMSSIITNVTYVGALFCLVFDVFHTPQPIVNILVSLFASTSVFTVPAVVKVLRKRVGINQLIRLFLKTIKQGKWLFANFLASLMTGNYVLLFAAKYAPASAIAALRIGQTIISCFSLYLVSLDNSLPQIGSRKLSLESYRSHLKWWLSIYGVVFLLSAFATFVLYITASKIVVIVWGEKYLEYIDFIETLCFMPIISTTSFMAQIYLRTTNASKDLFIGGLIVGLICLPLVPITLNNFGFTFVPYMMLGAAAATSMAWHIAILKNALRNR